MNNKLSNKCWKCGEHEGSFYHMWWTCKKAKRFWLSIYNEMLKVLEYALKKTPEMFLLGLNLESIKINDRTSVWYMITAARILYAKYWKQDKVPEIEERVQKNDICDGNG